ncbi:hypothetical protein ANO11243_097380 [Dothideomycetidae sp. 11243]|nr:hypothetical protein ANO11243_097380 [fungal sp. No.11243]
MMDNPKDTINGDEADKSLEGIINASTDKSTRKSVRIPRQPDRLGFSESESNKTKHARILAERGMPDSVIGSKRIAENPLSSDKTSKEKMQHVEEAKNRPLTDDQHREFKEKIRVQKEDDKARKKARAREMESRQQAQHQAQLDVVMGGMDWEKSTESSVPDQSRTNTPDPKSSSSDNIPAPVEGTDKSANWTKPQPHKLISIFGSDTSPRREIYNKESIPSSTLSPRISKISQPVKNDSGIQIQPPTSKPRTNSTPTSKLFKSRPNRKNSESVLPPENFLWIRLGHGWGWIEPTKKRIVRGNIKNKPDTSSRCINASAQEKNVVDPIRLKNNITFEEDFSVEHGDNLIHVGVLSWQDGKTISRIFTAFYDTQLRKVLRIEKARRKVEMREERRALKQEKSMAREANETVKKAKRGEKKRKFELPQESSEEKSRRERKERQVRAEARAKTAAPSKAESSE